MMLNPTQTCNKLLQDNSPILFLDTCTILDGVNSLHHTNLDSGYLQLFENAIQQQQNNKLNLITSESVNEEFQNNIKNVVEMAKKEIQKTQQKSIQLQKIALHLSNTSTSTSNLASYDLHNLARNKSEQLLNACLVSKRISEYSVNAMNRIRRNVAPAQRGGGEAKDCEIIECFLSLSKKLRDKGFSEPIVFITSNTKDFGKNGILRSPLDDNFSDVGAQYTNHLNHALNQLGF